MIVSDFDAPVGNPKVYVEVVSAPPGIERAGDDRARQSTGRRLTVGESKVGDRPRIDFAGCAGGERQQRRRQARGSPDATGEGPRFTRPRARERRRVGVSSPYDYFTFSSETTTRSGYERTRRHSQLHETPGLVYVLSASATTDGFDETRARLFERIVASFVVN